VKANRTFLVSLGALVLAVASLPLAPAASAANGSGTGIVDCAGVIAERPREIVLTCADAGVVIAKITWTSWTAMRAKGIGTLVWNTCLPKTCAAGIVQTYKVRVTLGGVASAPNAPVFTKVALVFPRGGPAGLETGTYTVDRPIAP
jgi:hypothetical protein